MWWTDRVIWKIKIKKNISLNTLFFSKVKRELIKEASNQNFSSKRQIASNLPQKQLCKKNLFGPAYGFWSR